MTPAGTLVLGSAPRVARPPYPSALVVWCVNGALGLVGACETHVCLGKMLDGSEDTRARRATREHLNGCAARRLVVLYQDAWPHGFELGRYAYSTRLFLDRSTVAAFARAAGVPDAHLEEARDLSTGLLAVCLALTETAGPVVVSGFSLTVSGHFYDARADAKYHRDVDGRTWPHLLTRWPGRLFRLGDPFLELPDWETACAPTT